MSFVLSLFFTDTAANYHPFREKCASGYADAYTSMPFNTEVKISLNNVKT